MIVNEQRRRAYHAIEDLLGAKWTFHVLGALADADHGFNELKRELGSITAKTLSARLSELRCLGFVEREVHATSPPSTTYRLTAAGRELTGVVTAVEAAVDVIECRDGECVVAAASQDACSCEC